MSELPTLTGTAEIMYFENNTYVGKRDQYCCGFADAYGHYSAYWPFTAYFCSVCGEIWGREILNYKFQYIPKHFFPPWVIESRRCVKHGDGLFLTGYPENHLSSCSLELLRREALALLLNFQKESF